MPKIKLLDKQVAELIAAGEVVERPSSVIKELVENSIDAGASIITVEIRNGGTTFMRITDNGCGIAREDVSTAFLRHATSKIDVQDDLDSISTLGFRGEALASISAVSKVEMLTKISDEINGTKYSASGGEESEIDEAGCPNGTTIIIRDLFFNVPARMKFLKKDSTEGNSIASVMDKIALSHPEISFRFIRDGKEQLHTPGDNKLSSAIYAVYGKEFTSSLIPVDYTLNGVRVKGYISSPTASRPNRSMQNFFINGRFIRSRTAGAALDEAFKGSVMVGKFGACVLHMNLSFNAVDVNVHPAKLEVRFVNEKPIFEAVYHAVKSALMGGDKTKTMSFSKPLPPSYAPAEKSEQIKISDKTSPLINTSGKTVYNKTENLLTSELSLNNEDIKDVTQDFVSHKAILNDSSTRTVNTNFELSLNKILDINPETDDYEDKEILEETLEDNPQDFNVDQISLNIQQEKIIDEDEYYIQPPQTEFKFIGEAFRTYIILEYDGDKLMFIDKHAAHERLIYEQLKAEDEHKEAQTLLEPIAITLDKDEYTAVLNNKDLLLEAGFEIDDFGTGVILLRTVPILLNGINPTDTIIEIAGYLASSKTTVTTENLDWIYQNVSCRAAIKGGDHTTEQELIALAKSLENNPDVKYCPHGRPISIIMKKAELEKQFGRII